MFIFKMPEKYRDDPYIKLINRTFFKFLIIIIVSFFIISVGHIILFKYIISPRTGKTEQILDNARQLYSKGQLITEDTWGNNLRIITDPQEIDRLEQHRRIRRAHLGAKFIIYSFGPDKIDNKGMGDDLVVSDQQPFVHNISD